MAKAAEETEARQMGTWQGPHLVGLDKVEVLPVHAEAMLEVPALLLAPGTEPICNWAPVSGAEQRRQRDRVVGRAGQPVGQRGQRDRPGQVPRAAAYLGSPSR